MVRAVKIVDENFEGKDNMRAHENNEQTTINKGERYEMVSRGALTTFSFQIAFSSQLENSTFWY